MRKIIDTTFQEGDIILVLQYLYLQPDTVYNLSSGYAQNVKKNSYFDTVLHGGPGLNQLLAEEIFSIIQNDIKNNSYCLNKKEIIIEEDKIDNLTENQLVQIESFINNIKEQYYLVDSKKTIGAIVMNCNPFTIGHLYLVQEAVKQVDFLYIFVVEENKSYFEFEDRLFLVKEGVKDLKNVIVVPSGRFIISAVTFPGYFMKDAKNKILDMDVSLDLKIFGQYLAPAFGIKKRFVGSEPYDLLTNEYNCKMKEILPYYGVTIVEIPRKEVGNLAISASNVRKYLQKGDFYNLRKIIPDTTYEFLINNYLEGGCKKSL